MKIALTHDHLFQIGGAEKVLFELNRIFPDSPVYTLIHNPEKAGLFKEFDIRTSFLQQLPFSKRNFKWYLGLMPIAWEQFDFSQYDVVISSSSAFSKGVLTAPNTLHISYCHSPTRYLWSDAHKYVEELKQPKLIKKILPMILNRLRTWDYTAAQRVDKFIANSEFVAKRIKKYYQREATVIYPPVNTEQFKLAGELGNYYAIVSRLRPYKRVDLAIKEKDHASEVFLQWYVTEQVEEEANDNDVLARLRLAGKDGNGLFMADQELATRVFTPPPAAGAPAAN